MSPRLFRVCAHKTKVCVETLGTRSHLAYLTAAVLVEGNLALRVTSGGCLVFCLLGEVLKDTEAAI